MALQTYSLWFIPRGTIGQLLVDEINQLAQQYASVSFSPHVTLVGNIAAHEDEMVQKTQELASHLHPCTLQLSDLAYTDEYYKSLFVKIEPSADILATYNIARGIFPDSQAGAYMPHISLLYGNFPVTTKEQISKEIGQKLTGAFRVERLYLYNTSGNADTWHDVKEFLLQG